jgi:hypothetical protein
VDQVVDGHVDLGAEALERRAWVLQPGSRYGLLERGVVGQRTLNR